MLIYFKMNKKNFSSLKILRAFPVFYVINYNLLFKNDLDFQISLTVLENMVN